MPSPPWSAWPLLLPCAALLACRSGTAGQSGAAAAADSASRRPAADSAAGGHTAPGALIGVVVGINVQWGEKFNRGDAAGLAAFYALDAVLMTPGGDVRGSEAIQAHFRRLFAERRDTVLQSTMDTETLDVAGDRAYEAGTISYRLRPRGNPAGGERSDAVRYVTFWVRGPDGRWLIQRSLRGS